MSSLRTPVPVLALIPLLALPTPARSQRTEQELVQHLDTLVPLWAAARERARAASEAYLRGIEARVPTESVVVGPLTVLVVPGEQAAALDVVGHVWTTEYAPWIDASPTLSRSRIFFRWAAGEVDYRSASFEVRSVQGSRWRSREYMEAGVRRAIGGFLKGDLLGTRIETQWPVPPIIALPDRTDVYRRAASVPSQSARACLSGNADACLVSMGLSDGDIPLDAWYTQGERYLLVKRSRERFAFQGGGPCIAGDYAACDRVLDDYTPRYAAAPNNLWAAPFDAEVRGSLLWYALVEGGAGAWGRLLAHTDDTPLAALEAASGLAGAELAAGWQRWLVENRPTRQAGLGSMALGALLWTTLLIALAARSTRWRLG